MPVIGTAAVIRSEGKVLLHIQDGYKLFQVRGLIQKDQERSNVDIGTVRCANCSSRGKPIFTDVQRSPQSSPGVIQSNITILSGPANMVDITTPREQNNALRS